MDQHAAEQRQRWHDEDPASDAERFLSEPRTRYVSAWVRSGPKSVSCRILGQCRVARIESADFLPAEIVQVANFLPTEESLD